MDLILAAGFERPPIDWHAVSPELLLLGVGALLTIIDVIYLDRARKIAPAIAALGFLVPLVPVLTLAVDGADRSMFGGAFVVDDYALVLKALFLIAGYITVMLSATYLSEGDYWESEYYSMLLASVLGMVLMASSRDLISIFVAIELVSIPAYMMATWRKRDVESNEAGLKYYLMGVFASAVFLYGMSILYGVTGSTLLSAINESPAVGGLTDSTPIVTLAVVFILAGFGFKVSAVPFHAWAPDTYEGAPTPVTAFLSVASKAAGFVALMNVAFIGFYGRSDVYQPVMFVLAVLTVTMGNLIAIRQTNIVRLMAYSGIAQAGFIMAPLAVAGVGADGSLLSSTGTKALGAMVTYLVIYAAMNFGAFAVILAAARRTRSGEISSFSGLFSYAPGLTVLMTIFLFSLAGIPPLAGWYAKFAVFNALLSAETGLGTALAIVLALNSVIALYYYANIAKTLWMDDAPEGATGRVDTPPALGAALAICAAVTVVLGILPGLLGDNLADFSECQELPESLASPDGLDDADCGDAAMADS